MPINLKICLVDQFTEYQYDKGWVHIKYAWYPIRNNIDKKTLECFPTNLWNKARISKLVTSINIVLKVLGSGNIFFNKINKDLQIRMLKVKIFICMDMILYVKNLKGKKLLELMSLTNSQDTRSIFKIYLYPFTRSKQSEIN